MSEPVVAGLGAAALLPGTDIVVDLGPGHPSAQGGIRLALSLDGDRVAAAQPLVGYVHRGAEKLYEARDYRQIVMLADRHDWTSAFASELAVVLAVEQTLGLAVPAGATWLRTLLAELNRVLSHLLFLGSHPVREAGPPFTAAAQARELLQSCLEELTGGRVHYMFNRVGGVLAAPPEGWCGRARAAIDAVSALVADRLAPAVTADERFRAATSGRGVLPVGLVAAYGVSGPVARASGWTGDLRVDEPYLGYPEVPVRVVSRTDGDALARFECLVEQCEVSLQLARTALARVEELAGSPVNVRLPKVVRAPEGTAYAWTENPLGVNGCFLVSRGGPRPWRCKTRSASFANVQVLREVLPGTAVSDLAVVLASFFFVAGDIDR